MKKITFAVFVLTFALSNAAFAEGTTGTSAQPSQACRAIDVHCKCTNPQKDFIVENQKLGRANPGEPGACTPRLEIDSQAEKMPIAYCLRGESVKDVRQGESQCTATWTCKDPCSL